MSGLPHGGAWKVPDEHVELARRRLVQRMQSSGGGVAERDLDLDLGDQGI